MTEEDKQEGKEKLPDWVEPSERDEEFLRMDADGDGVISRQEFEAARKTAPILSGDIGSFKEEGEDGLFVPLDSQPKEKMGRNLQFFLGALIYPIAVIIVTMILAQPGWMIADELGIAISWGGAALGYVGGAAWGFSSGHQSFAWGVLCSIVIVPMVIFSLFFGFCMIMISTGNF